MQTVYFIKKNPTKFSHPIGENAKLVESFPSTPTILF